MVDADLAGLGVAARAPGGGVAQQDEVRGAPLGPELHALEPLRDRLDELMRAVLRGHRAQHRLEHAHLLGRPRLSVVELSPLQRRAGALGQRAEPRPALAGRRLVVRLLDGEHADRPSLHAHRGEGHDGARGHEVQRRRARQVLAVPVGGRHDPGAVRGVERRDRGGPPRVADDLQRARQHASEADRGPVDQLLPVPDQEAPAPRGGQGAHGIHHDTMQGCVKIETGDHAPCVPAAHPDDGAGPRQQA
ncbi:PAS domain-containing protein [Sorangium sp. So ce321]|uniref:PAS domain-containing protein n=1 Tax=Sorangium sp. So ce321 TaxID=3133300 RepID=UPI003F5DC865